MIERIIKRVGELKIEPDEKADMLAEMVEELNRTDRAWESEEHKEKYLWSAMWGARYKSKRLLWPVDRPTTRGSDVTFVIEDLAERFDDLDLAVRDVEDNQERNDFFDQLGGVVKDTTDVKIVEGKLEGLNNREVGERLGLSEKSIWVRVTEMKKRWATLK